MWDVSVRTLLWKQPPNDTSWAAERADSLLVGGGRFSPWVWRTSCQSCTCPCGWSGLSAHWAWLGAQFEGTLVSSSDLGRLCENPTLEAATKSTSWGAEQVDNLVAGGCRLPFGPEVGPMTSCPSCFVRVRLLQLCACWNGRVLILRVPCCRAVMWGTYVRINS